MTIQTFWKRVYLLLLLKEGVTFFSFNVKVLKFTSHKLLEIPCYLCNVNGRKDPVNCLILEYERQSDLIVL